jgi:O-antigen/teichoic acid export membrane protein
MYLKLLGTEGFAVVGAYLALVALLGLLDLGLGTTLNREFARRRNGGPAEAATMHRVLVLIERAYWAAAALMAVTLWLSLPYAAGIWLGQTYGGDRSLVTAFAWMGLALASQFPVALYLGGFLGLERQVELNVLLATFSTLRATGAVVALVFIEPTLPTLFACITASNVLQCLVMAWRLRACLPPRRDAKPAALAWATMARFSGGVSATMVLGVLLTQVDRFVLGSIVPLSIFGAYALAWSAASALLMLVSPISTAVFPRLSHAFAAGSTSELASVYRLSSQLVTVAVAPCALALAFFSERILLVWSGAPAVSADASIPLSLLAVGTLLNAMMQLPYLLQLAAGWTSLSLKFNIAASLFMPPLVMTLAYSHGAAGAAFGWVLLNLFYLALIPPLMHKHLLPGTATRWIFMDTLLPAVASGIVVACIAFVERALDPSPLPSMLFVGISILLGAAAALLTTPMLRSTLLELVAQVRCRRI